MQTVKCDECSEHFQIKPRVKKHDGGLQETFFTCTHCGKRYTSFVTNADARKRQKVIKNLYDRLSKVTDHQILKMKKEVIAYPDNEPEVFDAITKVYNRMDPKQMELFTQCKEGAKDQTGQMKPLLMQIIQEQRLGVIHNKKQELKEIMDGLKKGYGKGE